MVEINPSYSYLCFPFDLPLSKFEHDQPWFCLREKLTERKRTVGIASGTKREVKTHHGPSFLELFYCSFSKNQPQGKVIFCGGTGFSQMSACKDCTQTPQKQRTWVRARQGVV